MLPKATLEEHAFAENPDIEILSDDNSMHTVYDKQQYHRCEYYARGMVETNLVSSTYSVND